MEEHRRRIRIEDVADKSIGDRHLELGLIGVFRKMKEGNLAKDSPDYILVKVTEVILCTLSR